MIFVTVGTQFPFDRLVKAVDDAIEQELIQDEVVAQVGLTDYQPRNFEAIASMTKEHFDAVLHSASAMISHAGMGSITMALDQKKPLLVLPRRKVYGEVVNDHQVDIARKFSQLGHLLMAEEACDLPQALERLGGFVPQARHIQTSQIADRISQFLNTLTEAR